MTFAIAEILEEEDRNPPSVAFLKKQAKRPVDWAAKREIFEKRTDEVDKKRSRPYERKQFMIRRETKFGRSSDEALEEWKQYEARCESDNSGYKGAKRLWISDVELRDINLVKSHAVQTLEENVLFKKPRCWRG